MTSSSSDPFDDVDDDIFNDPSTLAAIDALELQATQARSNQPIAPVPSANAIKKQSYHHQIAPPRSQRQPLPHLAQHALPRIKTPTPLNTEPRAGNSGFGWEHGGKRSIEGNVEIHVQNIKDRQEYWSNNIGGGGGGGGGGPSSSSNGTGPNLIGAGVGIGGYASSQMPRKGRVIGAPTITEDEPMDVIIDSDGDYQIAAPKLELKAGLELGKRSNEGEGKALQTAAAAAARREAIAGAVHGKQISDSRPPLSRSNSASSSSSSHRPPLQNRTASDATREDSPFTSTKYGGAPPLPPAAKFNGARTLARSASMGSHILAPRQPIAGPSRLPTIPSQSSQHLQDTLHPGLTNTLAPGSQGSNGHHGGIMIGNDNGNGPHPSQGSINRRTALELEEEKMKAEVERKKRMALENELTRLKEELQQRNQTAKGKEKAEEESSSVTDVTGEEETKRLKQEMWRYKGEVETVRKNQKVLIDTHAEELARYKKKIADVEVEKRQLEEDAKRQLETLRTQAVFSNHMTHSTIKNRALMSSQRPNHGFPGAGLGPGISTSQSQIRGIPTPNRLHGSPSRKNSVGNAANVNAAEMMTPGPAGNSRMKAKPQFGQLHNAFATPPAAILNPSKRARRAEASPSPSSSLKRNVTAGSGNANGTRTPTRTKSGEAAIISPTAKGSLQISPSKQRVGSRSPLIETIGKGEGGMVMVMDVERDGAGIDGEMDDWQPDFHDHDGGRGDVEIEINRPEEEDDDSDELVDRSLLLHHIFNYFTSSRIYFPHPDVSTAVPNGMSDLITQPALYSIINVPSDAFKSKFSGGGSGQGQRYSHEQEYIKTCSKLFQACGSETTTTTFETLLETVVYCLSHLLFVLVAGVGVDVGEGQGQDEVVYSQETLVSMMSLLGLLSSTLFLFPQATNLLFRVYDDATTSLNLISRSIFSMENRITQINLGIQERERKQQDEGRDKDKDKERQVTERLKDVKTDHGIWSDVLASQLINLAQAFCLFGDGEQVWRKDDLVNLIFDLLQPHSSFTVITRAVDLFFTACCSYTNFRPLIAVSSRYPTALPRPEASETSPLVEAMCRLLLSPPCSAGSAEKLKLQIRIVEAFCMLVISHSDAVTLVAEKSVLVPTLVLVLERESSRIWGVHSHRPCSISASLTLLQPTLSLLHHLIFPSSLSSNPKSSSSVQPHLSQQFDFHPPSQSTSTLKKHKGTSASPLPQGINLARKLHSVAASVGKEFNGLPHVFVSAFGRMAYGELDLGLLEGGEGAGGAWSWVLDGVDDMGEEGDGIGQLGASANDLRSVQFLAQDLLEAVVEGPEGDSIYEIYVEDEEMLDNPDAESGKTTHKENVRYQDQNQSQSQNQNRNQKQNQNQKQSQTQTQRQRRGQAVGDLNRTGNGNGTGTGDRDAEEMGDVDMDVYAAMDEEDEFEILS